MGLKKLLIKIMLAFLFFWIYVVSIQNTKGRAQTLLQFSLICLKAFNMWQEPYVVRHRGAFPFGAWISLPLFSYPKKSELINQKEAHNEQYSNF